VRGIQLRDGDAVRPPDPEHESAAAYWERQYRLVNGDYLALLQRCRDLERRLAHQPTENSTSNNVVWNVCIQTT